jgi:hypothetical protein
MSLTEASDRINGKAEEPCDIDDPLERKAALTKGQKTKIRRLYDIANVLASIGLVQKADGERRTRPTFTWIYHLDTLANSRTSQELWRLLRAIHTNRGGATHCCQRVVSSRNQEERFGSYSRARCA